MQLKPENPTVKRTLFGLGIVLALYGIGAVVLAHRFFAVWAIVAGVALVVAGGSWLRR